MHSREKKEWETGGDSEGLWRLERQKETGEERSKKRKDWETGGDSEGLGRLERPRRPEQTKEWETTREWGE